MTDTAAPAVLTTRNDHILTITINRPEARNAVNAAVHVGIGTALACMSIVTNTHLLLPLVCGLYVVETGSVLLQMTSYKYFGKRRIFRMSPIHHHFELAGWPETKIIIRFWMFAGLCAAIALGLYYADFIAAGGLD